MTWWMENWILPSIANLFMVWVGIQIGRSPYITYKMDRIHRRIMCYFGYCPGKINADKEGVYWKCNFCPRKIR